MKVEEYEMEEVVAILLVLLLVGYLQTGPTPLLTAPACRLQMHTQKQKL